MKVSGIAISACTPKLLEQMEHRRIRFADYYKDEINKLVEILNNSKESVYFEHLSEFYLNGNKDIGEMADCVLDSYTKSEIIERIYGKNSKEAEFMKRHGENIYPPYPYDTWHDFVSDILTEEYGLFRDWVDFGRIGKTVNNVDEEVLRWHAMEVKENNRSLFREYKRECINRFRKKDYGKADKKLVESNKKADKEREGEIEGIYKTPLGEFHIIWNSDYREIYIDVM